MSRWALLALAVLLISLAGSWLVAGCARWEGKEGAGPPDTARRSEPGSPAEPAEFTGSQACRGCHSRHYDGWRETIHARMLQDARSDPRVILGDFTQPGEPLSLAGVKKEDIVYTIGSKWKQMYVVRDGEHLRILPGQWIVKNRKWEEYYREDWKRRAYEDLCIGCHSTGYDPAKRTFAEPGVGCESCHGPGGRHARTLSRSDIINPKNLTLAQQTDLCGSCHARGKNRDGIREDAAGFRAGDRLTDFLVPSEPALGGTSEDFYPDGASRRNHQQYQDFIQSKHYESRKLSCLSCHSTHGLNADKVQLKERADRLCAICHGQAMDLDKYMPRRATSATPNDIRSHTFRPGQPLGR